MANYRFPKNYKNALEQIFFNDYKYLEYVDARIKNYFGSDNMSLSKFLKVDYNKLHKKMIQAMKDNYIVDYWDFVIGCCEFIPLVGVEIEPKSRLPNDIKKELNKIEKVMSK